MPIIERVVDKYEGIEAEEQKDQFKSKVQSYLRLYSYIAQIANFEDIGLEKLFIFLKYLNKKLPRRKQENINDILNAVDLDSFRVAKTWEGDIQLEAKDGVMEPLSTGEGGMAREDEKDMLSEIIKVLNDTYGVDLTDEHKLHIQNVAKRLEQHQGVHESFVGDNSESNRKFIFEKALDDIFLSYVNDHFDFYKKITQGKQKDVVKEILYRDFKERFGRGEVG